ncbi:aspartate/glutamate racemase family protein [Alcaligenes sp.]|uniref:aspartate/glutamate racemase family protein n=1 Tax=Alcaligenes sp. TaxID=512 RepID=UPI003D051841
MGTDKIIGVLGGMGPKATADFLVKLTEATPAVTEQDHLHVLIDCNPKVPDRNRAIAGQGVSPAGALVEMARGLERSGADFLVMACNTAHAFERDVRAAVRVPFISIVAEACDACIRQWPVACRVGVLAAQGCIDTGLYQNALGRRGITSICLSADEQNGFNALLYDIKLGRPVSETRPRMAALAQKLVASGADVVIAACTEVPLVLSQDDLAVPLLDATQNLATRCVRYARGLEPLPSRS